MNLNTMKPNESRPVLLMVDDDEEDVYLTKRAFSEHLDSIVFKSVPSGEQFFNFLDRESEFSEVTEAEKPDVVLLDINIPRENGFDILKKLKKDSKHSHLPVVMLTTSSSDRDIKKAYELGASSFICKSVDSSEMKSIAKHFCQYWFNLAKLPNNLP